VIALFSLPMVADGASPQVDLGVACDHLNSLLYFYDLQTANSLFQKKLKESIY